MLVMSPAFADVRLMAARGGKRTLRRLVPLLWYKENFVHKF